MLYLVTYDLNRPGQNYELLYQTIQNQGSALHCLQSVWLLHAVNTTVDRLQAAFQATIDATDRMLVVDITGKPRNGWMNKDVWEWARNHDC